MSEPRSDALRRQRPDSAQAEQVRIAPHTDPAIPVPGSSDDILASASEPTDDTPTIVSKNSPRPAVNNDDGLRGRRLAHFELLEQIGAGGMAAVLKARDTQLDRIVALKILPPEMAADAENVLRFHQEARSAAKLDHENIARVFFCSEDQRLHFIAFEFVEGENLRTILERRGRLPLEEALPYVLQIAAGLAHAAERGVVHRDIKPSNIIITPAGRAKLVDMGLARCLGPQRDAGLTQSGVTLGTFDYISPEQALEPRDADVRSDIYSLGCTFYHMVTGRAPVPEGTAAKKLHHHQHVPPRDPRELVPDLPDEVAVILDRMMAKDPRARYQNAGEVVQHLLTAAKHLQVGAEVPEGVLFVEAALPGSSGGRPYLLVGLAVAAVVALLLFLDQPAGTPTGGTNRPSPPIVQNGDDRKEDKKDNAAERKAPRKDETNPVRVVADESRQPERLFDDDNVTAERLLDWLDRNRGAARIRIKIANDITLRAGDKETFRGLVVQADQVTIEPKNPKVPHPTIQLEYGGAPIQEYVALTVRANRATITGIRFVVDARVSNVPLVGLHLDVREGESQVSRCDFVQANPNKESQLVSLLVEAPDGETPRLELTEGLFLGYKKRLPSEPMEVGGQDAVYRKGTVEIAASNCAFAPHTTTFRVEGNDAPLTLEHCSVMLGSSSTVFQLLRYSRAALAARYCWFARPSGLTIEGDGATLIRLANSSDTADFLGIDNRYCNLDTYLAVPGGESKTTLPDFKNYLVGQKSSDSSTALDFVPWRDDKFLARENEEHKAFRPCLDFEELRQTDRRDEHLIGLELLRGESLTANLPTAEKRAEPDKSKKRFVYPGNNDSKWGIYPTLEAAVGAAKPGDTIYIRQDGELTERTIRFADADVDLIIKPAPGYRPVLMLMDTKEQDAGLFRLLGGKVQFEGLEIQLRARDVFRSRSVLTLLGDGRVTFKDCVVTLDTGDFRATPLALVTLPDPSNVMKMDPPTPRVEAQKPHLSFTNCFVRGTGDFIWNQAGRPFDLDANGLLVAVSGAFCNVNVTTPASALLSTIELRRSTTFLEGPLLNVQGKDVKDLDKFPVFQISADECLFLPATAGQSLVRIETQDGDTDNVIEKLKAKLLWARGKNNAFGTFDPFVTHWQTGEMETKIDFGSWKNNFAGEQGKYRGVALAEPIAQKTYHTMTPQQLKPADPIDFGADTSALQKLLSR
jgi:hypothetical protein